MSLPWRTVIISKSSAIELACILVLCTCSAAPAHKASRVPLSKSSECSSQIAAKNEDDRCTADRREPTDNDGAARLPVEPDSVSPAVQEASPSGSNTRELAQTFLDGRLAFWQRRLNLSDWQISVAFTPHSNLKPHTLGGIRWDKAKKSADMWVLDPSDYRLPLSEMLDDMEFTVVHELVHLELVSLPHSEASRSPEEQAVNRIADALLALDRKK